MYSSIYIRVKHKTDFFPNDNMILKKKSTLYRDKLITALWWTNSVIQTTFNCFCSVLANTCTLIYLN